MGNFFGSCPFSRKKLNKCIFLHKKVAEKFGGIRKMLYLCTRNSEMMLTAKK